ncbi:MAG: efflux RND transporter periplasmic adaptor subunit [Desulfovibrionaceae bacterium]|nr:efflux RND transporter periplasmic adaptor subunit [Desulfovibrionaceae bacterium]
MADRLFSFPQIRIRDVVLRWFVPVFAFFVLAPVSGQCADTLKNSAQPAAAVAVGIIKPMKVPYISEFPGRVAAFEVSEVRPQVGGIIQKRLFTEGSDVRVGDVLYQIDPALYRADYESAKAALRRAEANVAPARLRFERYGKLLASRAVSRQEYDDAKASYEQARAEVGVCRAAVDSAKIRLEYTRVTSPISGRIGRSAVTPGALVTAGQASPLASVYRIDTVYVDVTQSSADMLRMKRAMESGRLSRIDDEHAAVHLILEDGTMYQETGSLQFSEVNVEESTGSVTLRAFFPNTGRCLLPGMYVRARLAEAVDDQAILLPQKALLRDEKGAGYAYVVNESGMAEKRMVEVGRAYGSTWIVQSGLREGDRVVLDGFIRVRPGMAVHIVEEKFIEPVLSE